jgi:hypothetical protein
MALGCAYDFSSFINVGRVQGQGNHPVVFANAACTARLRHEPASGINEQQGSSGQCEFDPERES